MKIAIDIDKTILSCKSKIYNLVAMLEKHLPQIPREGVILSSEDKDKIPEKFKNLFGKIGDPSFYQEVDGSIDVINELSKKGNTIYLLSSRPNMRTFNRVILNWIDEHKLSCDFIVVNCNQKAQFCKDHGIKVLIDDSLNNCMKANSAGVSTVFFDPNESIDKNDESLKDKKDFYVANDWEEIKNKVLQVVEKIEKKLSLKDEMNNFEPSM